ncbi:MAG: hypothetical protein KAW67_04985, partial [Candidatus Eisenbacteria sp.]|nr:hypothetical protein [Candidatus Eisenbacteria bacterium]
MVVAKRRRTWTWSYTLLGVIMGLLLPTVATMLELALAQRHVTLSDIFWAQSNASILWLMDLSPIILGFLGRAIGRRQDDAVLLNHELERRIHQVSEANKALADEIGVKAELEEQLRHSQKLEAVGRLAGGVAHDFNNLLTVIMGNLNMIASQDTLNDVGKDHLRLALDAAGRAAELTRSLLSFGRSANSRQIA